MSVTRKGHPIPKRTAVGIAVEVQYATGQEWAPTKEMLSAWVGSALREQRSNAELTIRIVDEPESKALNERWRKVGKSTNVLSFPAGEINEYCTAMLGDLVVCAPVVRREARQQGKSTEAHWAHMVVHGTLHLLGYDHISNDDAREMELLEVSILKELKYSDPYMLQIANGAKR